jgi:hypothetical protein
MILSFFFVLGYFFLTFSLFPPKIQRILFYGMLETVCRNKMLQTVCCRITCNLVETKSTIFCLITQTVDRKS